MSSQENYTSWLRMTSLHKVTIAVGEVQETRSVENISNRKVTIIILFDSGISPARPAPINQQPLIHQGLFIRTKIGVDCSLLPCRCTERIHHFL
jgi:hypothetical protein